MKIRELVSLLQSYDQNLEIFLDSGEYESPLIPLEKVRTSTVCMVERGKGGRIVGPQNYNNGQGWFAEGWSWSGEPYEILELTRQ